MLVDMKDATRVYALADAFGIDSTRVTVLCRHAGLDRVRTILCKLTPTEREIIEQLIVQGGPEGNATSPVPVNRSPPTGHEAACPDNS